MILNEPCVCAEALYISQKRYNRSITNTDVVKFLRERVIPKLRIFLRMSHRDANKSVNTIGSYRSLIWSFVLLRREAWRPEISVDLTKDCIAHINDEGFLLTTQLYTGCTTACIICSWVWNLKRSLFYWMIPSRAMLMDVVLKLNGNLF